MSNQIKHTPEPWTFTADSCGYMLYLNGKPQGGARTMGTHSHTSGGRVRHWKHRQADLEMHTETASRICEERNRAALLKARGEQ